MSDSLYSSCAEVLSVCQIVKDDLVAVLDPDTGYAPRMRQICHDLYGHQFHFISSDAQIYLRRIDEFEDRPDSRNLQLEIETLRLEENTWGLLQALMSFVSSSILSSLTICPIQPKTEPAKPIHHPPNLQKNSCSKTPTHQPPH